MKAVVVGGAAIPGSDSEDPVVELVDAARGVVEHIHITVAHLGHCRQCNAVARLARALEPWADGEEAGVDAV